jgi:hypothetical protein
VYFRDGVNSLRAISLLFLVFSELALSATLNIMTASYHLVHGWGGGGHNPEQAVLKTVSCIILGLDPDLGSANFRLPLQNLNLNCLSILKLQNVGIV